jgi:hypothetical protein
MKIAEKTSDPVTNLALDTIATEPLNYFPLGVTSILLLPSIS